MALIPNPVSIELDDIQGLLVRGYGQLPRCKYYFLKIDNAAEARAWLSDMVSSVTPATEYHGSNSVNVAFTHEGLLAIGLDDRNLENFSMPFREGAATERRRRILGDYGRSDPSTWNFGGWIDQESQQMNADKYPHILLIVFGSTDDDLEIGVQEQMSILDDHDGVSKIFELEGYRREDNKEHFGFHDGISQPIIQGSGRKAPENELVATGEFVFGYLNEHDRYPYSPLIRVAQGDMNLLAPDAAGSGYKDLGRNGTYLVYRQLMQEVDAFHEFTRKTTIRPDGHDDPESQAMLEAKMVGRWPNGAPLVKYPDKDPGVSVSDNDFGYAELDPHGYRCPYGSHLRRNNPRDTFRDTDAKVSWKVSRRHRIIRRGRLYDTGTEKGLHFICFNTDIEQQYEFIQHAWANSTKPNKKTLTGDPDPIIGVPDPAEPGLKPNRFTIQQAPVDYCIKDLTRFVHTRGAGYFFMPGLSALRYLTTLGETQIGI